MKPSAVPSPPQPPPGVPIAGPDAPADSRPRSPFSVVIPAHNEETVIERCLRAFAPDLDPGEAEVVVVANGCSDGTAARARTVAGVRVVERVEASKIGALNAGDAACSLFPRIYLDGDVVVSAAALRALALRLRGPDALIAAPRLHVELGDRPWAVRSWYRAFDELPYAANGLVGLGVYAVSAAGRARFGRFPDVVADDLFVSRLFTADERLVVADQVFTIQAPRDLRSLIRVRTRVAFGNSQLSHHHGESVKPEADMSPSTGSTALALATVCIRNPGTTPAAAVYVLVTALARWRARRTSASTWLTDTSTR